MSGERQWDRREFIGTVGATAAAALVPAASLVQAAPVATAVTGPELLSDWTIDDMFGVWPRYADPIPHGRPPIEDTTIGEPLDAL